MTSCLQPDGRTLWIAAPSSGPQEESSHPVQVSCPTPLPCQGGPFRMKKISLKTIRKSLNINKGKEEGGGDFVMLQQPSLVPDFSKEDALFGGCYNKDLAGCDLGGGGGGVEEEDKAGHNKGRSKSESLMGSLKRRLSAKQKAKVKGGSTAMGSADDDDTFSSSSVPISFNEVKAQRPLRSASLRSHHYSPSPWPLRPVNSDEACIKMEVKVKAMVHSPSPSPNLNGVRKDFHHQGFQMEGIFHEQAVKNLQEQAESLKNLQQPQNGDQLHLNIDEHVPVVLGLTPQDYIQYTMPLEEGMYPEGSHSVSHSFCLEGSLPMEVVTEADSSSLHLHADHQSQEDLLGLNLNLPADLFMESQSVNGLFIGCNGVMLQSCRDRVYPQQHPPPPPRSPLLPALPSSDIPRAYSRFSGAGSHVAARVRHHLNFDPNSAPGMSWVYDSVQSSGPMVVTSLTKELKKLARQGWYWGPITRWEAEEKLVNLPDGSFLVRDSSDDRYLLSLSFRSQTKTLHTRIEHSNGRFSFYEQPDVEGHTSMVDLIEYSIKDSETGAFCYSRSRLPGSATYPVRLTNPVSRFMHVRSLQYLCRFVIRQYTRIDLIQNLPLPNKMKDYLQEKHY